MSPADSATGELLEERSYRFDAREFALTWLTVASAASEDSDRYVMHRSVNLELDEHGVRLASTDSYRFWSQWVGEYHGAKEPDYEQHRGVNVTVSDIDFRARDLMKHIAKVTKKEDDPPLDLALAFGKAPIENGQIPGLERDAVVLTLTEHGTGALHESVLLTLIDGEFPDLRRIYVGHYREPTERIAFNPILLNKMMKAVPGSEEMPCTLEFAGPQGAALVRPFGTEGGWPLRGLLMPARSETEPRG